MKIEKLLLTIVSLTAIILIGCKARQASDGSNQSAANTPTETGVEKVKPAPGTGNVQGKVFYNSKPVENIEVKLCETFSRFLGGCGGQTYSAMTDKDGEYVITNIVPKTYESLLARVFDTDGYVFATTGIGISAAKYEVVAGKTLFIPTTHLFKSDLKIDKPQAGARVSTQNLELAWKAYPDAAYYKFSLFPEDSSITSPYVNERVSETTFHVDKPLQKGT